LHATWGNDNRHCTAYLLRHLRKFLLLCAVSHNKEAQVACLHLASMPTPKDDFLSSFMSSSSVSVTNTAPVRATTTTTTTTTTREKYDANELRRLHDDEHGNVGLQVRLTMEDLECLDFILQPPNGGRMDEPCLRMGELMWSLLYEDPHPPPTASIQLGEVEREIRHHLELELAFLSGMDDNTTTSATSNSDDQQQRLQQRRRSANTKLSVTSTDDTDGATSALSQLTLLDHRKRNDIRNNTSSGKADMDDGNQFYKEVTYKRIRGTTILLQPNPPESPSVASVASGEPNDVTHGPTGRLHDVVVSDCSDAHFYLLQPFEHVTIAACTGCTIVVGAVAGLLHIVDCEKTFITSAARRVLVSNSCDVQLCLFTPCPPLLVGDNRSCQFAPFNTYYDGMREDLLATGLAAPAAVVVSDHNNSSRHDNDAAAWPLLQCASNKWKQPIELSKLEVPQVPGSSQGGAVVAPLSPGADDRAMVGNNVNDVTMQAPVQVPASEYRILFVPFESEASKQRRLEIENNDHAADGGHHPTTTPSTTSNAGENSNGGMESQYCRLLAEVLQLSPFRLPLEYERSALLKAERMKSIQQAVQKNLTPEQQYRFEEELNRGFREWLVTSGNLRQVLDLVHMEKKDQVTATQ
jgi:Tubulin binding cofactor C